MKDQAQPAPMFRGQHVPLLMTVTIALEDGSLSSQRVNSGRDLCQIFWPLNSYHTTMNDCMPDLVGLMERYNTRFQFHICF